MPRDPVEHLRERLASGNLPAREECLSRVIPLGERGLRWALEQFVEHFHRERPHQGLEGKIIDPEPGVGKSAGPIARRTRMGGLLSYYYRAAG